LEKQDKQDDIFDQPLLAMVQWHLPENKQRTLIIRTPSGENQWHDVWSIDYIEKAQKEKEKNENSEHNATRIVCTKLLHSHCKYSLYFICPFTTPL
jgi:hypothetical protein